jgi:hypothetical protein
MDDRNYTRITTEQFRQYLPLAYSWAVEKERFILENGTPLSVHQMSDARLVGVSHPEQVRLLPVGKIPFPEHQELRAAAAATRLITPHPTGLTLRYGIFIRSDCWGLRRVLVHELAHTVQYERLGGIGAFLECYLFECLAVGYPSAPMEQEAIKIENTICGPFQLSGIPEPPALPLPVNKPHVKGARTRRSIHG